jgi:hypothetical protein
MTDKIELTRKERSQMLNIVKGLGREMQKHNIDKETQKEMILITLQETAKELISKRPNK